MLNWDNYSDRLSNINIHQELILNIFKWNYPSLQTLNESMILDIASIIWKTNDLWMLEIDVSDVDFLDNIDWLKTVKDWIKSYILKLKQEIKIELFNSNLWETKRSFTKNKRSFAWLGKTSFIYELIFSSILSIKTL